MMFYVIFSPDIGLDRRSLFHMLLGIVVGFGIQNINHKKVFKLHNFIAKEFIDIVGPHIKKLPKKVRKHINIKAMVQPLRYQFDIHSVLMIAFFREALEMYLEQGKIVPQFVEFIPGAEHWINRLILDPLMLVIGYWIARSFPRLFRPAMISAGFLFGYLVL